MATARGKLPHLYLESRSFVSAFVNVNWDWRIQQDSSEFYIKLLPAMLEGNASIEPTIRGLLGFHTSTAITCPSCNHVTSQTTTDYNLAIHINNGGPLTNILRHTTFAPNIIHGRHCDMCDHTGTVPQLTQLLTGPDVLVMDLLRFTNLFTKNMAQVSFGQDLDLTPFTTPKTELKYLLAATIHHKGNLNSGHFIAVAKCPNGRWQELNDPKVRNVRVEEALNPHGKWTPCTLIWTRVDGHGPAVTRI